MKKALVTGITGQDGSYLAELLLAKGYEVHGIVRRSSTFNRGRIDHLLGKLQLHYGDLADSESLSRVVLAVKPEEVYNLAAQSHVKISFEMPTYTGQVSGLGAVRLLEALRQVVPDARFYQASTSELYGKTRVSPQSEETPFHPRSPYAVAKLYSYWATVNYREAYDLFAVNGVLFNHESPRRGENFVTRKITIAAAEIAAGVRSSISLGNLDARRDWGFAGDFVEAMWLMLQREAPADYVIGTGEEHSVREFAERAFAILDMHLEWAGKGRDEVGKDRRTGKTLVKVDDRYFRPSEVESLRADPRKAKRELGWEPKVTFDQLVEMMVTADLKLVEARHR